MRTCVIAITDEGKQAADAIASSLEDCFHIKIEENVGSTVRTAWERYEGIICIMAAGIVVRSIADLVNDKTSDPCVVVTDQKGRYAVSLLSGHLGGGNELARRVADITGGQAVITTASDVLGKTAVDLWARRNGLYVPDRAKLTEISARQVNGKELSLYSVLPLDALPSDFSQNDNPDEADLVITYNKHMTSNGLCCIATQLFLGIGCNRGTSFADIEKAFCELCMREDFSSEAFAAVGTIDVKADEKGILEFAEYYGLPLQFYSREELNAVQDVSYSEQVMRAVGAKGVCEPASYLAAVSSGNTAVLRVKKYKWQDVTFAVSERIKNTWE